MNSNSQKNRNNNVNIAKIRSAFPILKHTRNHHPLAYLDNANTSQKPQCVIDAINHYYCETNANIHRGVHHLSEKATAAFEETRHTVQRFINAKSAKECIFVKSTTEALNLVAQSFGHRFINAGDEILISAMEHHSNIVPWQILCEQKSAHLKVIPMNEQGELKLAELENYFSKKTKLLAIAQASNAIGTLNPIKAIIAKARTHQIPVLVDGAQAAPHLPVDVQDLDCDFYCFSSHKLYGPTGIGVLYGKSEWLEAMPPYQGGGDMILQVTFEKSTYNDIPFKFEAGTPPIAAVVALKSALDYIESIGWDFITQHENALLKYATDALSSLSGLTIIGTAKEKVGVISFTMAGVHPHDIGSIVDESNVAIRTGHHCAMPVMDFYKVPATARASFGVYNTKEDIDQLVKALENVKQIFKR